MARRKALILDNPRAGNHDYGWRKGFGAGLARHGWEVTHGTGFAPGYDLLVVWGVRRREIMERQKQEHGALSICVLERGYVGCRFTYSSVSFGGELNGRGVFTYPMEGGRADPARWVKLWADQEQPWRQPEPHGHALIIGQVPGDMSLAGSNFEEWKRERYVDCAAAGIPVRFRQHPLICSSPRPLEADLAGARVVLTFSSNTAVLSVLAGVPTCAWDPRSMAWAVTGRSVTWDGTPVRDEWRNRLAWCQWSKAEMESGECADAVRLA